MKRKIISLVLTLAIVFSIFVNEDSSVYATTRTADEAVSWVQTQVGKAIDVDGYYGAQCVDLIMAYYQYLGVSRVSGNGKDYATNPLPSGWSRIQGAVPQKGDILVYTSGEWGHVAIYESDSITYHQNFGGQYVRKVSGKYNNIRGGYWGVIRPNFKSNTKPANPQISKNQIWYDLSDRIEITAHADGATSYFMSMVKDGNKIISQNVDGGKFSMDARTYGQGNYSAYFSCTNSAGTVDTKWIDFSVVGPATYKNVSSSNSWYDLTDTVSISVDTTCAKGQVIGIDKEGAGRIITENTESTYEISASKLGVGKYSAYFSVYNGSGGVDTKRISFEIVDAPNEGAVVSTSKTNYTLKDEVELSVRVSYSKNYLIGIDKIGEGRVITEKTNNGIYKIPASKLGKGKYSAYFSVWNNSGGYDTSRVEFSIDNELSNPIMSITKEKYGLNENIEILASADGEPQYYTAIVYDKEGKEILNENFTGHSFSTSALKLGKGIYTAKVVCTNYAFSVETKTVTFEVVCNHKYTSEITTAPTCNSNGIKTYTCSECGDKYTETIKAVGHKYEDIVIKPTADEKGYTLHECTVCGYSYKSDYTNPAGHNYTVIEIKEAECTVDGYKKYKCAECNDQYIVVIPAKGHDYKSQIVLPTCIEKGYTFHECTVCGESYKDSYINEKGHSYASKITSVATCTSDGVMTYTCSRCNEKKTTVIPTTGHNYETTTIAPSCENEGYTLHKCEICGSSYKDNYTDRLEHNYKATVTKQATCLTTGTKQYVCENCGDAYAQVIPKTEHNYVSEVKRYATCVSDGLMEYVCPTCGDSYSLTISAIGHKYIETIVKPTSTEKGYTIHTCTECGECYMDNYVNPIINSSDKSTTKYSEETIKSNNLNSTHNDGECIKEIKEKTTKIKSLKKAQKSIKVKWKKIKGVAGYQIQYSTSSKFKKAKKITIKSAKTTSKTIKKLKSKKRHYVRIRTYIVVNGKKKYSNWSKKKSQKTK